MAKVELRVTCDDGEVIDYSYENTDVTVNFLYKDENGKRVLVGHTVTIESGVE